ncbi:MAG: helix-turn-helix transcriptional regulator [bacterium]|nr:helix-turn-helix transcriptional regulator [bacterium]
MENLDYVAVGRRIKKIRQKKQYSQQNIAEMTNISEKYISEIECGKKEGRLEIYARIAAALNVSIDEFVKDFVTADSTVFESNINSMYKQFGKTRREMLLAYMEFLNDKPEYDCINNKDEV